MTPPLLDTDGTAEDVTKLQLSSPEGTMRLQLPTVSSSDDKLLKVDIRGVAVTMNQGEQFLEVSSEPTEISVIYTCQGAGVADVELGLWHAVITSAHAAEGFHLHWRKQCGDAVYKSFGPNLSKHVLNEVVNGGVFCVLRQSGLPALQKQPRFMDIFLKSDLNMTKVQAVSHGRALPGFEPRCRNQSKSSHPAVDGVSPKVPSPACGHQQSALEVSVTYRTHSESFFPCDCSTS